MRIKLNSLYAIVFLATSFIAQTVSANYLERAEVHQFIAEMENEGFNKKALAAVLAQAQRKQSIVRIMTPKKSAKTGKTTYKPWSLYRKQFVNNLNISRGLTFFGNHQAALKRAEKVYGVPAEIITSIIGIETAYGRNKGNFRVLDALMTLSFDSPRRNEFFKEELKEFLLLCREQGFSPDSLKGSYAGAMGYGQFIPSSYRKYAVDFDNDGNIDIWNNPVDAIGSVANYFKAHGWVKDGIVVERAYTSEFFNASDANITREPNISLEKLKKLGFSVPGDAGLPSETLANLVELRGDFGKEYWFGFQNFFVITEYNHSRRYALSVYQLAQEIKAGHNRKR